MSHKGSLGLQSFSSLSFIALGTAMNSTAAARITKAWLHYEQRHFPLGWDRKTVRSCLLTTKQNIRDVYYAQVMRLHGARARYSVLQHSVLKA
jgi:hypothetical protein